VSAIAKETIHVFRRAALDRWRLAAGREREDHSGAQSRDRRGDRHRRACGESGSRPRARRRGEGLCGLAESVGLRPIQDDAQGRRHPARQRGRDREPDDHGAGQAARRAYGRTIPARQDGVYQLEIKEPVGPVAAFTPWNFPINQAVRKVSAALAAGCSIIIKGPEETPAACAGLIDAYVKAGVPAGAVNLVFGVPGDISSYLIPHPIIRKISFTGSTAIGKQLAMLAGQHMKRVTMELGGHAPAIVFADADVDTAVKILSANKFRNAGQVCVAPTRFMVQKPVYDEFVGKFVTSAKAIKVGDGLDEKTRMGPLAHSRRLDALEAFVGDAVAKGAKLETGGRRIGNKGYFFEPTVLTNVSREARIMNEEPFGPVAVIGSFDTFDEMVTEANRLPYGLAAYAYTRSEKTAAALGNAIETGMISINHHGLALPEVPFGGVKDSGYGTEGGADALAAYLNTKFITQMNV
jgi:succinate-semialdehyde dehydrogenase/glutarate-semialdehyde dehydrogenase